MIKPLLAYQAKEHEKLMLISAVEGGRAKRELDDGSRSIESAKRALLNLENDAKSLLNTYESVSKNLGEVFEKLAAYNKSVESNASEEEAAASLGFVSGLLSKVSAYETQLADIGRKVADKTAAFEDAKATVVRAQKSVQTAAAEYEKQKSDAKPKIDKIDGELKALAAAVEPAMLEKYKQIRKQKSGTADIVIPLSGNRCGGCHFELPLSLIHTISAKGYITCEECGKIIYKVG